MKYTIKDNNNDTRINVGGKANSLLHLVKNGYNVPSFFVITSNAYEEFLASNAISLKDNPESIKGEIDNGKISQELIDEVNDLWAEYKFQKVAVRSSASNEDGEIKSFAGQYMSFLNVEKQDLMIKIKECWKSLFEDNVLAYSSDTSKMNVIVQEIVDADYSGVAFSLDPTSQGDKYSIIEAVQGLGEKLVSGSCTPSRFSIRRETSACDFFEGNIKLDESLIKKLEENVLKIEKLYGKSVDIEWALKNNNLYILQARNITAFNITPTTFKKVLSREKSLIEIGIYYKGEFDGIKRLTNSLYYFKPLFIYDIKKGIVHVYYTDYNLEENPKNIYREMSNHFDHTQQEFAKALEACDYLNDIVDNNRNLDYKLFIQNMTTIYPFSSLGNLAGHFDDMDQKLKDLLIDFRNNYDYILYKANEYLLKKAKEKLSEECVKNLNYYFIQEIFNNDLPNEDIINERKKGYIYYDDELILTQDVNNWLNEHKFVLESQDNQKLIKGSIAYNGVYKGKVKLIYNKDDFSKMNDGDIIVTTMTTPKFTPILNKAGAIITDEGGITCHAAIIARELKVPCIVGCKNATDVLSDDMEVEVNADIGIINIL